MSRRTDLLNQLLQSDKFGEEKKQMSKSFLAATAELILTDLVNIAINGFKQRSRHTDYQPSKRQHDLHVWL